MQVCNNLTAEPPGFYSVAINSIPVIECCFLPFIICCSTLSGDCWSIFILQFAQSFNAFTALEGTWDDTDCDYMRCEWMCMEASTACLTHFLKHAYAGFVMPCMWSFVISNEIISKVGNNMISFAPLVPIKPIISIFSHTIRVTDLNNNRFHHPQTFD